MRIHPIIHRTIVSGILFLCAFCVAATAVELTVIMPGERTITVNASPEQTVGQMKQTIFSITALSPLNQTLLYKGDQLRDDATVSSLGLSDGDTIRVVHAAHSASTKRRSQIWWVLLVILAIIGIGALFMRKKPSWEYDGK